MRQKLVLWCLLLLAGFLIGFILQYSRRRVQQAVGLDKTIAILPVQPSTIAASRHSHDDVSGVVQKNYGKAGEYSREVLDQAQQIAGSTQDPALRHLLRDTGATRDQITADLAKEMLQQFRKYSPSYRNSSRLLSIDGFAQLKPGTQFGSMP